MTPSTRDDRPGEGGDVPVGWFAVEQAAEILITSAGKAMSAATFQFRATRDVLALTLLLAGFTDPIVDLPRRQLRLVRDLLSVDQRWQLWCRTRLRQAPATTPHADLRLAWVAWDWLGRSWMLTGFTVAGIPAETWAATPATPAAACCLGLAHGRWVLDAHLHRRS